MLWNKPTCCTVKGFSTVALFSEFQLSNSVHVGKSQVSPAHIVVQYSNGAVANALVKTSKMKQLLTPGLHVCLCYIEWGFFSSVIGLELILSKLLCKICLWGECSFKIVVEVLIYWQKLSLEKSCKVYVIYNSFGHYSETSTTFLLKYQYMLVMFCLINFCRI